MRSCRRFLAGIPHQRVGHPCVTHPSATPSPRKKRAFDLHVLGTPPAFILSQDQTRHPVLSNKLSRSLFFCIYAERSRPSSHYTWLFRRFSYSSCGLQDERNDSDCSLLYSCCSAFHFSIVKVPSEAGPARFRVNQFETSIPDQ